MSVIRNYLPNIHVFYSDSLQQDFGRMTLTERPELIKELQALSLCYSRGYFLNLQGDQRKHACKKGFELFDYLSCSVN